MSVKRPDAPRELGHGINEEKHPRNPGKDTARARTPTNGSTRPGEAATGGKVERDAESRSHHFGIETTIFDGRSALEFG